MIFSIPCLMGIEGLLADELRFGGFQGIRAENGRVLFDGNEADGARANVQLRCGERVLIRLAAFAAQDFDALFDGVKALPWEDHVGSADAFPVKGFSIDSKLHSVPACQKIIKKAVAERLKSAYGVQWLEESGSQKQIQFSIIKDSVEIYLDTTGAPLYRRGYKLAQNEASIRETLAAAMVKLARYRGREDFIDPMCGSGTIAVEAAQAALKIAPGARRGFDAAAWSDSWAEAFKIAKADALRQAGECISERGGQPLPIVAMDISPACVRLTRENAARAGVGQYISVIQGDALAYNYPQIGTLICNPPYGQRMLEIEQARQLCTDFGKALATVPNLKKYIISSDSEFETHLGIKADKKRKLYNGMIKCDLYMFFRGQQAN